MRKCDDPRFREMYRTGVLQKDIAKAFGTTVKAVQGWVSSMKVERRPVSKRLVWTVEEDAELRRFRENRIPIEKIRIDGKTQNAIEARCVALGLGARASWWNEERDRAVRECYAKRGRVADAAEAIGATRSAFIARAGRLGLKSPPVPEWTEEETKILRAQWGKKSAAQIADQVGRSIKAVQLRARRIGLAYIERSWSDEDKAQLRKLWVHSGPAEIARLTGRGASAVGAQARLLGLPSRANQYPSERKTADRDYESVREAARNRARQPAKPRPKPIEVEAAEIIPINARPWLTRKRGECAYPHGARGNIHSCCKPTFGSTPYCEGHAAVCLNYDPKAKAA